jgi:hypothetical protein
MSTIALITTYAMPSTSVIPMIAGKSAEPRPREHELDDDDTCEQQPDLQTRHRKRRSGCVAQRVLQHDGTLGQPLRARRAHVVLAQDVEQGAAQDPSDGDRGTECEHERGEDDVLDGVPPLVRVAVDQGVEQQEARRSGVAEVRAHATGSGQEVQLPVEEQDQQDRTEEGRRRRQQHHGDARDA